MITNLLKQAYAEDIDLWVESGKLKFRAPAGALTEALKQEIAQHKEALICRLEQIEAGKIDKWIVFEFGEMYNKRLGLNTQLCIFRNENETFTAWKGNWRADESKPFKENTLVTGAPFKEAFDRANNYVNWSTGKKPVKGGSKQW